jgi:hypothetical protein
LTNVDYFPSPLTSFFPTHNNVRFALTLTSLMDPSTTSNASSSRSPTLDHVSVRHPETEDLSICAVDLVNTLRENSLDLANNEILSQLDWVQSGRSSTSMLVINHRDDEDELYKPAILEFVGEISPASFWLYACGGWNGDRGPTGSWLKPCPFEKARSRAHIRCSSFPFYARFWSPTIDNLKKIVQLAVARVNSSREKTIDYNLVYGNEIRIRHSVFFVSKTLSHEDYDKVINKLLRINRRTRIRS